MKSKFIIGLLIISLLSGLVSCKPSEPQTDQKNSSNSASTSPSITPEDPLENLVKSSQEFQKSLTVALKTLESDQFEVDKFNQAFQKIPNFNKAVVQLEQQTKDRGIKQSLNELETVINELTPVLQATTSITDESKEDQIKQVQKLIGFTSKQDGDFGQGTRQILKDYLFQRNKLIQAQIKNFDNLSKLRQENSQLETKLSQLETKLSGLETELKHQSPNNTLDFLEIVILISATGGLAWWLKNTDTKLKKIDDKFTEFDKKFTDLNEGSRKLENSPENPNQIPPRVDEGNILLSPVQSLLQAVQSLPQAVQYLPQAVQYLSQIADTLSKIGTILPSKLDNITESFNNFPQSMANANSQDRLIVDNEEDSRKKNTDKVANLSPTPGNITRESSSLVTAEGGQPQAPRMGGERLTLPETQQNEAKPNSPTSYDDLSVPPEILNQYTSNSLKKVTYVQPTAESLADSHGTGKSISFEETSNSSSSPYLLTLLTSDYKQDQPLFWLFLEPKLEIKEENYNSIRNCFKGGIDKDWGNKWDLKEPALVKKIHGDPPKWELVKFGLLEKKTL